MTRYVVLAALFVLSLSPYIDRAAISSAKEAIGAAQLLDNQAMGAVFSAFALGYAIAQIPAGCFADLFGLRLMLTCVATLWSVFTALTGAATGLCRCWPFASRLESQKPGRSPAPLALSISGYPAPNGAALMAFFFPARASPPRFHFP
jgi:MFS family permease